MPYEFLSPDWIRAVRSLRGELDVETETPPVSISLNMTVTDAPAGSATTAHVDTTSGIPLMDEGHLDAVETRRTKVLVDQILVKMLECSQPDEALPD